MHVKTKNKNEKINKSSPNHKKIKKSAASTASVAAAKVYV